MIKWFVVLFICSVLWSVSIRLWSIDSWLEFLFIKLKICTAQSACTSTINSGTTIVVTCPSGITTNALPLYSYSRDELEGITSIVINGPDENTRGPFTSIPPNICLLPNLQVRLDILLLLFVLMQTFLYIF